MSGKEFKKNPKKKYESKKNTTNCILINCVFIVASAGFKPATF